MPSASSRAASILAAAGVGYLLWRLLQQSKRTKKIASSSPDSDLEVPFSELHKLRDVLDREGAAIVTGVVSAAELQTMEREFEQDLASLIDEEAVRSCGDARVRLAYERFEREGLRGLPEATIKKLTPIPGFALKGCVAAGAFSWRVRSHPNVHRVYSAVFPEDAGPLVSSLDVTFYTTGEGAAKDVYAGSAHVDQNGNDTREAYGLGQCSVYQGILYVWPADEGCTTTAVWPGSHKSVWPRMMKDKACVAGGVDNHYTEIRNIEDTALREELEAGWQTQHRKLRIGAGSLLLWNSRTVHTGVKAGRRFAQAVCLEPARERPPQQRLAKMRLAALGIPGTHWARIGHQHDVLPKCEGWMAQQPLCGAKGADTHSEVELPLRPAIRPAALAEGADLEALRPLARIDWEARASHHCVWDSATPDEAALLEASVGDAFKRFI